VRHLPSEPLAVPALPPVTSRDEYEAARARLLIREKAHTREGDAIAADRRRLPMIEIPATVTVVGAKGEVPFLDVFDGRRMLAAYFHMWHDGKPRDGQCIGCTYFASQVQAPLAHLHARDVTLDLLDHRPRQRGGFLVLRPAGPHRIRAPGAVGRLPSGLAQDSGRSAPVARRRAPAGAMGRHRRTCRIGDAATPWVGAGTHRRSKPGQNWSLGRGRICASPGHATQVPGTAG
jgi:hypothetical protein